MILCIQVIHPIDDKKKATIWNSAKIAIGILTLGATMHITHADSDYIMRALQYTFSSNYRKEKEHRPAAYWIYRDCAQVVGYMSLGLTAGAMLIADSIKNLQKLSEKNERV